MSNLQIFSLQILLSLIVYFLIMKWYISPRLSNLRVAQALVFMLFIHSFRHIGLTILIPSIVDSNISSPFITQYAFGEYFIAALAVVCLVGLTAQIRGTVYLVWIFNIIGAVLIIYAWIQFYIIDITQYRLGTFWFIPTFYMPALLVSHYAIFSMLIKRKH
ncbi:MAG TPA: hypothetical protein VMT35_08220 [Ignavibacteriaceae bacterium]|nr:hypothetical protein [Ignavibacteriaceae bacterium]